MALEIVIIGCYNACMSIELEMLKNLRTRGASIQMQEDVSSFLGGYDNPLFLPTMDFILQLQNQARSQSHNQEQGLDLNQFGIPKVYDPSYFNKISLKATGEAIRSAAIGSAAKQAILDYLQNMEIQRARYLGVIGLDNSDVDQEINRDIASAEQTEVKISQSRRRDRGAHKVKSFFQSLAGHLRALKVDIINQQNLQNDDQHRQTQKAMLNQLLSQNVQKQQQNHGNSDDSKLGTASKFVIAEKAFMRAMRKIFRPNRVAETDSMLGRLSGRAATFSETEKTANLPETKRSIEVVASRAIDAAKQEKKETKKPEEQQKLDKSEGDDKNRDLRQRDRLRINQRLQRQRDEAARRAEQDHRVHELSAKDAIKNLQNLGVSMGENHGSAINNKDLKALSPTTEKQRGA